MHSEETGDEGTAVSRAAGARWHHALQNGEQEKTYAFVYFWNFPFKSLGLGLTAGS